MINRTSYDVRQNIDAKVIGVLKGNNEIRRDLLSRNLGMYPMYPLDEGIGYIAPLYSDSIGKPLSLGEDGLLGYTHSRSNEYSKTINGRYGIGETYFYYAGGSRPSNNSQRWGGRYDDYAKYIEDTYGLTYTSTNLLSELFQVDKLAKTLGGTYDKNHTMTLQTVLRDFLQYDNIGHIMETSRIGTVNPYPLEAIAGAVTTNINNFSGTDTPLGLISNKMYAHALRNSANFNSLRKTQHISEGVYDKIGNNLVNISYLPALLKVDRDTGRIALELGAGIGVERYEDLTPDEFQRINMIDGTKDVANSNNARYRNMVRNIDHSGIQKYGPFVGYRYEYTQDGNTLGIHWGERGVYHLWENDAPISDQDGVNEVLKSPLLQYTNELFNTNELWDNGEAKQLGTLISRFHTEAGRDTTHNQKTLTQTAVSRFGMSHGRNLLTKDAYNGGGGKTNGYSNPYCRTWTHHHRYEQVNKQIRPFFEDGTEVDVAALQENWWHYGRRKGSAVRLKDNTVLNQQNGRVNIAPSQKSGFDIRKCMFSIENLAWKDVNLNAKYETPDCKKSLPVLSPEQQGPNGGRIMWFPPYGLTFSENVNTNWNPTSFIGRGEKIYTYTDTERSGNLSFMLLVDHPSVLDMWKKNGATGLIEDDEQTVLRYFTGCETLDLPDKAATVVKNQVQEKVTKIVEDTIPLKHEKINKKIVFYAFYPNNYTGKDDGPEEAMRYLTSEYGCGQGSTTLMNTTSYKYANEYVGYNWCYRVDLDSKFMTQRLNPSDNYKDLTNFEFNKNKNTITNREEFSDATHSLNDIINGGVLDEAFREGFRIKSIVIKGNASSDGSNVLNIELANNRGSIISQWLTSKYSSHIKENTIRIQNGAIIKANPEDLGLISNITSKLARCSEVTIELEANGDLIKPELEDGVIVEVKTSADGSVGIVHRQQEELVTKTVESTEILETRYDEEAQYFEMLESNDSFLYSKVVDKVKYFTPAFHTITPEGFNARLAFLHQCTRQGHTIGATDGSYGHTYSAGNLAFGRPPICVLRIGDFFHTKIIITSVTITYENPQWEMNPEGIGMQPMFAKVDINFTFLGGSDIEGPITRLQNAVSFNFYANQSIYDDRADMAMYDNEKKKSVIRGEPWLPTPKTGRKLQGHITTGDLTIKEFGDKR